MGSEGAGAAAFRRPGNMGLHDDPPHPVGGQALAPHFKGAGAGAAAPETRAGKPHLCPHASEKGFGLPGLLPVQALIHAPPVADPSQPGLEFIRHRQILLVGYGASQSCCSCRRSRKNRCLDPVQTAPEIRCADKAKGKAWRQLF